MIGTCNDVLDLNTSVTPCITGENQVLIWDLGERSAGEIFPDINYTTVVGVEVNAGTIRNVVKIEAPTDASPISQRRSEIGMSVTIPASINIVKSTEENVDYPSLRERTTTVQTIDFVMDMRNGKAGDVTDLDVIDILPFEGDGIDGAIKFNTLGLKRKSNTSYHGTSIFANMELMGHPLSSSLCDLTANGGVKYYYTDAVPTTINIAPTVGDANKIGHADSIWCEGSGCIANADVTAVRAAGPRMEAQAICQLKVSVAVQNNLAGDNYANSTGASATGITLPVLSNSLAIPIVGSSLGDYVWYDRNANGIQDNDEDGMSGVEVRLLTAGGIAVKNPSSPSDDYMVTTDLDGKYNFGLLNAGNYIVAFIKPTGYLISNSNNGNSGLDSNIVDKVNSRTGVITLGLDSQELDIDAGFYTPIISGNIFNDGNNDGTVNGTKVNTADGAILYVTLLDGDDNVLSSKAVLADGSYSFDGEDNVTADSNFTVVLSGNSNAISSTLPVNWNSADGENIGIGAGLDESADGKVAVVVTDITVLEVNFGINKKPLALNFSAPIEFNPGGDIQVDVPSLNVSDNEDGTPTTITIVTVTSNAEVYYNGTKITAGQVITNFDNSLLKVNPDTGTLTVNIIYNTTDKVGIVSDDATITMPFKDLKISGQLFLDGNGDGNINGSGSGTADGTQLYVSLLKGGIAISSMQLSASGTYEFTIEEGVLSNTSYMIVLSDENNVTVASLPTDWDNKDGENVNSVTLTGNDGTQDGVLSVNVVTSDVLNADFAINKKPIAGDVNEPTQVSPGNGTHVQVPDLNISDSETIGGLTVTITTIPNNALLEYNGTAVTAGQVIQNFDNTLFTVDPQSGDQNVSFTYTTTDGAGTVSDSATATLEFTNIAISGTLFNDGNANGNVDGNETDRADLTVLFVTLLDESNTTIASKTLNLDGTYHFDSSDGLAPDTNYTIVLTDALNSKDATLPSNWNNADGENIGLLGLDGNADGVVQVHVLRANIEEVNFGINEQPVAMDKIEPLQFNPGGTSEIQVLDLNVSDREDAVLTIITITALASNGILYYDGVAVVLDVNITDVNLSKFTVNPNDGDVNVVFNYTTTDSVGVVSDEATVSMPFVGLKIKGNVFNDGNNDGTINGTGIAAPNGTQLYVTLVDGNGTLVASHAVKADGSYVFEGIDGLIANSNYKVILSMTENNMTASLAVNWSNNDGEHVGVDAGTDGQNDGVLDVNIVTSDVEEVNFGINKKPVASDVTEPLQLNLGSNIQVNVPSLVVTDNEDTVPTVVSIVTVPVHATLYYDGVEVVAGQVITNFDNSLLTIDPENGDLTVSFTYSTIDAAGDESDAATISMSFDGLEIRGNIFNDGNNDGSINGVKVSKVNGSIALYATLLDNTNSVMATVGIGVDGSYGFNGIDGIIPDANYTVTLSTEMNSSTASLPSNWNNADGEHIGIGVGLDGNADGLIAVEVQSVDVPEVNFGINEQPVAMDKIEPLQFNPGGTSEVQVLDLNVSDREDAVLTIITITALASNGILYYDGVAVVLDANITDVNLSKFTVNPNDGDVNVVFNYTTTDSVGVVSDEATVSMPFVGLKIKGNVFNDGNNDGTINGTGIAAPNGTQLYVTLVDGNGTLVASHAVKADGSYVFEGIDGLIANSNYKVILSTTENNMTASLAVNWSNNDGEHVGVDAGTDGQNDGVLDVNIVTSDVEEANFGINKKPVASDVTEPLQLNLGSNVQVNVPSLVVTDNEDTVPIVVSIVTVPVHATLYYDGVEVVAGQVITNFDNSLLTIDPENGDLTVSFTYSTIDAAGDESDAATISMSFDGLEIRGNIFNDGNNDGSINGVKVSKVNGSIALYATLLDNTNSVMATVGIGVDGSYGFNGIDGIIPDANYTVTLSTEMNSSTASLPSNWNNADGEHIGIGVGLDGNADGLIAVEVQSVDVPEVNFGINEQPVALDKIEPLQFNPGGTSEVQVLDLNVSDREDAVLTIITITALASNGILYYDGVAVVLDVNITDVNLSKFTVNPNDGDVNVVFNYTTTDSVGVVSDEATVSMPFVGLKIKGNVFNDGNNDGTINGTGIAAPNGTQLYVTLVDGNGTLVASHAVKADGSYVFEGIDGLIANSNYKVILSMTENNMTASLAVNWSNNDGEHVGVDAGTDGQNDGVLDVNIVTSDVEEVNFGINKKPVASDVTEPLQLNLGSNIQVNVPSLVVTDNEDTVPTVVSIVTVPVHATLYYDGVEVVAGQVITNFDNSLLTIDPENGDLTVSFTYSTIDAAGDESDAATISMSFDGLEIRGNIFNDGNNDGSINGVKVSKVNGSIALYATLLDNTNSVMATVGIGVDGSYGFNGIDGIIPDANYTVTLSTEMNSSTASLPSNWNNADGEHIGIGVGLDGNADGLIAVEVQSVDVPEVNFGINEQPVALDKIEPLQLNPGKDTQVPVPTLEITDKEDGTPKMITIKTLANNATLYYDNQVVLLDANYSDANLSKFTVDPENGDLNVTFTYTSTDATGWESNSSTVLMSFDGLEISGQVFVDGDGDNNVDGLALTSTYNLPLFVTLVDNNSMVISSLAVNANGSYEFNASTGIVPDSNYTIVVSTDLNSTLATLSSNWMHSNRDSNGTLVVSVGSTDVIDVNFGLNKRPTVGSVTAVIVVNPDTNTRVVVPTLNILANEDGETRATTITLTNLPNNGTVYYNAIPVIEGQVITNFNNALLTVDPDDGELTVRFNYTSTDDAGYESERATVEIPFSDPDTDGDGRTNTKDLDDDNDGILDTFENNTSLNGGDTDGDGIPDRLDLDSDGDGILDLEESNPNFETVDANGDGVLDSTTDMDNDGLMDTADANDSNPTSQSTVNPVDSDNDGQPDFQDVDSDNDGLSDLVEGGTDATLDENTDGMLDSQIDTDKDGIADSVDIDNQGTPASTPDTDDDGIDNYRDIDSDNDTLLDVIEIGGTDTNNDGQIEPVGTLVSGINLADENANGIPDVLEPKLLDDHQIAAPGEVVTIDLLANDSGDVDKSSIVLVIPDGFKGTARLSPDGKRMIVDGEGEWSVDENGILTFTPEDGFMGTPTPIMYSASNTDGTRTATANVTITLNDTVVGGVTDTNEEEVCETYSETAIPVVEGIGLFLMLLFGSLLGMKLVHRER